MVARQRDGLVEQLGLVESPGARVEVLLDSTGWTGAAGEPVDLDGDGLPGTVAVLRFETGSTPPLSNTAVVDHRAGEVTAG